MISVVVHVEAEVKVSEAPEGADAGRDLSLQAVGAQVEREQESEVTDSRGDGAGEPLGTEVQGYHPPPVPPAAGDALPAAVAGALVPRVQHAGVARDLGLESHKSSLVVRPWVMAWRIQGCSCTGCRHGGDQQEQLQQAAAGS